MSSDEHGIIHLCVKDNKLPVNYFENIGPHFFTYPHLNLTLITNESVQTGWNSLSGLFNLCIKAEENSMIKHIV